MRSESGVNLVSGALQSSLARAQKHYQFHGKNSSHNSEENSTEEDRAGKLVNKRLSTYCDSIGSKFASYTSDQFLELGNSLVFEDGGFLERTIPKGIRDNCVILKQNVKLNWNICDKKSAQTSPLALVNGEASPKKAKTFACNSSASSSETVDIQQAKATKKRYGNLIEKQLKLLKDKTISKNKRRRLTRKLRKLKKLYQELSPSTPSPSSEQPTNQKLKEGTAAGKLGGFVSNLVTSTVNKLTPGPPSKKVKKGMGPESDRNGDVALKNGTGASSNLQLPEPKRILYPKENIQLGWKQRRGPGAGFLNFGNTCYLNSSLQALFHIPAFVNWIQSDCEEHRRLCNGILENQTQSPCIICLVYFTLQEHGKNSGSIRPRVLDKLKSICKHFSYGRQEDAHEFLRYLLEGMERSYLTLIHGLRLDNRTKETNPLGQIFGGYIRTEVTCLLCGFVSTTFQPSAELQLDIRHTTTLEDALHHHFRKERLDNNDYKCEKCRTVSQATKQFSLELPPLVLCLQLKRFTLYGTKISKRIHCNKLLNMSKFLHKSRKLTGSYPDHELKYRLVALVTHLGQSPNCGHYTAIAEGSNGSYYQFDDQFVHEVSTQTALNNDAYVIIYEMEKSSLPFFGNCTSATAAYSSNSTLPLKQISATATSSSSENGNTPVKKFAVPFAKSNGTNRPALKPTGIGNTNGVAKSTTYGPSSSSSTTSGSKLIKFGIPENSLMKSSVSPIKITTLQPGIALTNSARLYSTSTSAAAASKSVLPKENGVKLVPYSADVDNDESDKEDQIAKEEIPKKENTGPTRLIGPVLESKGAMSPKLSVSSRDDSSAPLTSTNKSSPERTYGVKRKLAELLGPAPASKSTSVVKSEKPAVNATSKWTITPSSNGYSSDPENSSKKRKSGAGGAFLVRSKSTERIISSPIKNSIVTLPPPLISNKGCNGVKKEQLSPVKMPKADTNGHEKVNNGHQNGQHFAKNSPSMKKRKRSDSSSSSSSSSSQEKKRRKKKVKKEKRKSKRSSSSSSSSDSDSSSRRRRSHKKHKTSKHKTHSKDVSKSKDESKKPEVNGWAVAERETLSAERERILRKARNPSRSPPKTSNGDILSDHKEKFDPNKIERREKTRWNGTDSVLSKSIDQDRKAHWDKTRDEFDEELDTGRMKKQRQSHSPSREKDETNKFQSLQDKKGLVSRWSNLLDGYGEGFRDHNKSPVSAKKPRDNKFNDDRTPPDRFGSKSFGNSEYDGNRHFSSYSSSSYRNNNRRRGFNNNYRGNRQRHQYDNNKSWKHRNTR